MRYSNPCLRLFVVVLQDSVNNVNLVIQQQIASGKDYCISLIKAPLNVEIGMMVKCNTLMINVVIRSL